jgi:hypothetical protein
MGKMYDEAGRAAVPVVVDLPQLVKLIELRASMMSARRDYAGHRRWVVRSTAPGPNRRADR